MRDEELSPGPAHVGQRDCASIFMAFTQEVWNGTENLSGDLVDWSESILPGPE